MMTHELALKWFEYKDGLLYWKVNRGTRKVGDLVGAINGKNKSGYYKSGITINGTRNYYTMHRLIYLYHHGYLPKILDHIDGNRLNNNIENLRPATHSQNNFNRAIGKNNTSGYKNITRTKCNSWQVIIAGIYIGCYKKLNEAKAAAEEARNEIAREYARAA